MQCFVYASARQADTYVWLRARDDFACLPDALAEQLGTLRYVVGVDLARSRELPNADAATVLARLAEQDWYLQLPPAEAARLPAV